MKIKTFEITDSNLASIINDELQTVHDSIRSLIEVNIDPNKIKCILTYQVEEEKAERLQLIIDLFYGHELENKSIPKELEYIKKIRKITKGAHQIRSAIKQKIKQHGE